MGDGGGWRGVVCRGGMRWNRGGWNSRVAQGSWGWRWRPWQLDRPGAVVVSPGRAVSGGHEMTGIHQWLPTPPLPLFPPSHPPLVNRTPLTRGSRPCPSPPFPSAPKAAGHRRAQRGVPPQKSPSTQMRPSRGGAQKNDGRNVASQSINMLHTHILTHSHPRREKSSLTTLCRWGLGREGGGGRIQSGHSDTATTLCPTLLIFSTLPPCPQSLSAELSARPVLTAPALPKL